MYVFRSPEFLHFVQAFLMQIKFSQNSGLQCDLNYFTFILKSESRIHGMVNWPFLFV